MLALPLALVLPVCPLGFLLVLVNVMALVAIDPNELCDSNPPMLEDKVGRPWIGVSVFYSELLARAKKSSCC